MAGDGGVAGKVGDGTEGDEQVIIGKDVTVIENDRTLGGPIGRPVPGENAGRRRAGGAFAEWRWPPPGDLRQLPGRW